MEIVRVVAVGDAWVELVIGEFAVDSMTMNLFRDVGSFLCAVEMNSADAARLSRALHEAHEHFEGEVEM